ncbi:NADH dehydrogenase [ubiquinone] 1 alpha subcomplex subunit 1 [Chelonus insularis]|uniref:NADH dehydrogenase [ubiquinone] 1 alpha subcomplex subunit 1 n=1 Tax=Chelonus insularis TaxID=460826 RepID=UPI00158C4786|nr:NADH dehydrogenase [ubiquinone] 1 alpha subcomplex subunit 1 [Chelonus insularis]XP_034943430.1 NADH dehydrogenase [ubiquinone] 1 alpha subcomplex subunit 1 [Chelonus insularis]
MWWEILPSAAIMLVCLSLPHYASLAFNRVAYGNDYRRRLESVFERNMFSRDGGLTGAPWVLSGLDAIPDEDKKD